MWPRKTVKISSIQFSLSRLTGFPATRPYDGVPPPAREAIVRHPSHIAARNDDIAAPVPAAPPPRSVRHAPKAAARQQYQPFEGRLRHIPLLCRIGPGLSDLLIRSLLALRHGLVPSPSSRCRLVAGPS